MHDWIERNLERSSFMGDLETIINIMFLLSIASRTLSSIKSPQPSVALCEVTQHDFYCHYAGLYMSPQTQLESLSRISISLVEAKHSQECQCHSRGKFEMLGSTVDRDTRWLGSRGGLFRISLGVELMRAMLQYLQWFRQYQSRRQKYDHGWAWQVSR